MKGASGQTKQNERNEKRRSISRKERAPSGILLIYIHIRIWMLMERVVKLCTKSLKRSSASVLVLLIFGAQFKR